MQLREIIAAIIRTGKSKYSMQGIIRILSETFNVYNSRVLEEKKKAKQKFALVFNKRQIHFELTRNCISGIYSFEFYIVSRA